MTPTTPAKADPGARVMTQSGGANTMTNQTDQGVTIDPRVMALCREIDRYWLTWVAYKGWGFDRATIGDVEDRERDCMVGKIALTAALTEPPVPGVEPNSNESIPDVLSRALFDWLKELIDAGEWNPTSGELDAIIQHLTDKVSVFVWEREQ